MDRTTVKHQPGVEAPEQSRPNQPEAPPAPERIAGASAEVSQGVERPVAPAVPDERVLDGFSAEQGGPAAAGPVAEAAPESRPLNELVKEPAVREALQSALDNGAIKYDSLKAVVKEGLETGEFNFKSEGQARVVKAIVADAIKPAPANVPEPAAEVAAEPAAEVGQAPEAEAPQAEAPKEKLSTLERAFETVEAKLPDGLDSRVKDVLRESPTALAAKNSFDKSTQGKAFNTGKPSVSEAVRYTNAVAVKTGDFSKESIETRFSEAFNQPTKGDLMKVAESNGVRLYPESKPAQGGGSPRRSPETGVEPDSRYGRAITAAQEKGIKLPTPANGQGYTVGEARDFHEKGLIELESVARGGKPAAPEVKPQAAFQEKVDVFEKVFEGYTNKEGQQAKGVAFEDFKQLSRTSQNELRGLVSKLDLYPNATAAAGELALTGALAKEFKEKVLDKQAAGATA